MISIELIKKDAKKIENLLAKKGCVVDFSTVLNLDADRRKLIQDVETLKSQKNKVSSQIPMYKKEGKDTTEIFAEMKKLGNKIEELDKKVADCDEQIWKFLAVLPNPPDEDLLEGGKENNKVLRQVNKKPEFDFKAKNHVDLCVDLGLIDYDRGVKLSGNGSWLYRGLGAKLEWALLNFFIDEHTKDGYEFILPPHMLNYDCGYGAGQFPKFADEVYWIDNKDEKSKFLLPTAETVLVNMYKGEIIPEEKLPMKFFAYTPCYRREAGSYRQEERGMIRGHQFNKVEMVQITTPEQSAAAFEELVGKAENLVKKLGLHYQVSKLAAGDCSASMKRTYDIEIWIPSMQIYKEVSSASNAGDYQARRNNTKYRNNETKKAEFVHTLNASGLATSRLIPAIVEQYQNADGSVTVPEVLRKYMGGLEVIKKY
ncbi:MAG: serine--tRNA ligase [Clostridia bacterium]|nr:serine--tRNA ligase [Clostridia bacterium]